jgi:carboxypeptidase PM20D1
VAPASTPRAERHDPARVLAEANAVSRLCELVRIPTVSAEDETTVDWPVFDGFIAALVRLYPATHSALGLERIDGYSLLFRWGGAQPGSATVLMAHYDVVAASDDGWTHPPFDAHVDGSGGEQLIWGRGTLDDKGSLVSILEAVESLVLAGFQPQHDVYLSFGHNEETTGTGARRTVDALEERGVRPALVLDEGGAIVERVFPGVRKPIAVVGVSEKGISTMTLTVTQAGGHASTPPRMPATVRLSRAVTRLSRAPFPARLGTTNLEMLQILGGQSTGLLRFVFQRAKLFRPVLIPLLARLSDETNAMVRTTVAVTQLTGSRSANALAERAEAVVDTRIAVGSSVAQTVAHVKRAVRDPRVVVEVRHPSEPSPVSPTSGPAWDTVAAAVSEVYPRATVTPYVMLGATDSRHFTRICPNVYRFSPFEMSAEERGSLHARDERIHSTTFLAGIRFYTTLIEHL